MGAALAEPGRKFLLASLLRGSDHSPHRVGRRPPAVASASGCLMHLAGGRSACAAPTGGEPWQRAGLRRAPVAARRHPPRAGAVAMLPPVSPTCGDTS